MESQDPKIIMSQNPIESDLRFRKIIENNYSGITLLNKALQITYRSPSADRITGWDTEAISREAIIGIVHPDDQHEVTILLDQLLTTAGASIVCSFRFRHRGGHYIWLENTFTNMLDEPDVWAIVCNFRDITEQKNTQLAIARQTEQITGLLETMTDGFIALDENLCYIYANNHVAKLVGRSAASLIGKHIWTVFPDAVGSATYDAIETVLREKRYVCNEDFYAPLQLWLENRVYPSGGGIYLFIRDITRKKKEEHQLKLLESVITNTMDAVVITEAEPCDEPGPRILYVNEAFTKMTGYTAEEVIGKTPCILQGPKTDRNELEKLSNAMRQWLPFELTVLNYKKNGEEFWNNFNINPVADEKGWFTHWVSIERDVTERNNKEQLQRLLKDVCLVFNKPAKLNQQLVEQLEQLLGKLVDYGHFLLAEVWLTSDDNYKINLVAKHCMDKASRQFYDETAHINSFLKGKGLPGSVWASQTIQIWGDLGENELFLRREAAKNAGISTAYGIPLLADDHTIGVLVLGFDKTKKQDDNLIDLFGTLGTHIGAEIRRKQLELELKQIFNWAPDLICSIGSDGQVKKANPAMCLLLEYSEAELVGVPVLQLIDPADREQSIRIYYMLTRQHPTMYFENRFISKTGKTKWISWTTTRNADANLLLSIGKDITEKKEMEELLGKVTGLARIGIWELDVIEETLYWSDMIKEIHETGTDFEPDLQTAVNFYKEQSDQDYIKYEISNAIEKGTSFDFELQIITAKHNTKWVRVIGEPEFVAGRCIRIYGSLQDIDARVKAEIEAKGALLEKNTILESIGDAFFAVDKSWTVNYWNNMAEKVLGKSKMQIIGNSLWHMFPDSVNSLSFTKYNRAIETGKPQHFEDYYPPLDKWYEVSAYPSTNGLSVYFKDITQRKLSEEQLRDSEKRYSDLFQLSPLPKWVFDLESLCFLDVNKAAIEKYGYTEDEFLSMTILDIRPESEIPQLLTTLNERRSSKQFAILGIITHQKKNGDLIVVDIQSTDMVYKGRNARLIVANDITERTNYINAIELQNKKLTEISWMQSHVIRAPLCRIMGLVSLLDDGDMDVEEVNKITEYIKISANELDNVIHRITDKTGIVKYK